MLASCNLSSLKTYPVCFRVPLQEFYVDGQPMCSHRRLTAGTETGNTAQNDISKAGATAIK